MSSSEPVRLAGRLKVGYVLKRFPRLSETFILNEMLALERQGVEIDVYSLKKPLDEPRHLQLAELKARVTYVSAAVDGAPAMPCRMAVEELSPGKSPDERASLRSKALAIGRLARAAGVDHLHAHFASDATTAALIAADAASLPFSFTAHARDIYHCYVSPEVDDGARRLKIGRASFVATVSEYNRRYLQALCGDAGGSNVVRLYNGIDLKRFSPAETTPRSANVVLSVGRLVEKKGLADLIDACAHMKARGLDFNCHIVGEGPLRQALEAQIASLGLNPHVRLLGARTQHEVLDLMRRAAVMALPCVVSASADQDGLPTVLLEALGAGLPAVSTRVAGIPEIIVHEQTGLLVEPGQPAALGAAIARLITDSALAQSFAAAGRAAALGKFDLDTNVGELRRMFARSAATGGNHSMERDADAHRLSLG